MLTWYETMKKSKWLRLEPQLKATKTWRFSRRSSIMMFIYKWLMLPKTDAKASIATVHVYNMMMSFYMIVLYSSYPIDVGIPIFLIPICITSSSIFFPFIARNTGNYSMFCSLACLLACFNWFLWVDCASKQQTHHVPGGIRGIFHFDVQSNLLHWGTLFSCIHTKEMNEIFFLSNVQM